MSQQQQFIHSSLPKEKVVKVDATFEVPLRPQSLAEFAGKI